MANQPESAKIIPVQKCTSIMQELTNLHEAISKRAYELFEAGGEACRDSLANWLRAERELVQRPAVELRQADGTFELTVALAGVDPRQVEVQATPEDVLIRATHEDRRESKTDTVHLSELTSGELFRTVRLPARIDPESVKAELKNGLLRVTAAVALPAVKKVQIEAA